MSSSIKVKPRMVNVGEPAGRATQVDADRAPLPTTAGRDQAAPSAVVHNIASKPVRARELKQHALARTRVTRCGSALGRASAAKPGNPGFRGCRSLAQRNGTLQSMMPLLDASRGSDWKEDGARNRFPFLLYGGVSRRQPRYPMLSSRAGSFASLPCDSFANCCFSSLYAATRHDG